MLRKTSRGLSMNKNLSFFTLISMMVVGCKSSGGNTNDSNTDNTDGATSINITATDTSTGTDITDSSMTGTATDSMGSDSTTDDNTCMVDEDCSEIEKCENGFCVLDEVCLDLEVKIPIINPNVMLVLDHSGSMVADDKLWDHDANPDTPPTTRWFSLHNVVTSILSTFDNSMYTGLVRFPSEDASGTDPGPAACVMENTLDVEIGPNHGAAIIAKLPPQDTPKNSVIKGGTPATAGIELAVEYLKGLNPAIPRVILLITDGAANCVPSEDSMIEYPCNYAEDDETLAPTIATAFIENNIRTFIIGIDIQKVEAAKCPPVINYPSDLLNAAAEVGGAPKNDPNDPGVFFYNSTNEAQLLAAFETIAGQVLSCVVPLVDEKYPNLPPPKTTTRVTVNGVPYPEELPADADCTTTDGWKFTTTEQDGMTVNAIELCGGTCKTFQETGIVDVDFICEDQG